MDENGPHWSHLHIPVAPALTLCSAGVSQEGLVRKMFTLLGLVPQAVHLWSAVPSEALFVTPQQFQPGEFF